MLRTAAGKAVRRLGGLRRGLGDSAVIVAFHRVNDRFVGDELTTSASDYENLCRFFRSDFDVVSLTRLLDAMDRGESTAGMLVITHDDGYRDNYEVAAPILAKLGLPATIFVSSGFVETEKVAWWDRELDEQPGWMSWDQVRALRESGLEIGAHTVTHADLGKLSVDEAWAEITDSKRALESALGESIDLFAYPYGGSDNVTEANRELVWKAGFRCCLASHGGVVPVGVDVFRMPRIGMIPFFENPDQFALALALGRA